MDLLTIFDQFAFPIAVVLALMWYVVKTHSAMREDLKLKDDQIMKLNEIHSTESKEFTDALNKNTIVLERICTLLGTEGVDKNK